MNKYALSLLLVSSMALVAGEATVEPTENELNEELEVQKRKSPTETVADVAPFSIKVRSGVIEIVPQDDAQYTFSIDGGETFQDSPVFENLSAATYNVVVKDANCVMELEVTVS